jgi:signal transduction histidine kinase
MSSGGGRLTIEAFAWEDDRAIKVLIGDTGEGISQEDRAKIFDLFFTTKDYGTGYGLWRAKSIIGALGGTIEVSSERGEGTTFEITLPTGR